MITNEFKQTINKYNSSTIIAFLPCLRKGFFSPQSVGILKGGKLWVVPALKYPEQQGGGGPNSYMGQSVF